MAFEVYRPRSSRENVVSLTKHHIRLSRKIVDKLGGNRVEVAYDRDKNQLRITVAEESGMILNKNKIGARGIFKYFDIENRKGNYPAEYNEKENAVYVDLNQTK